MSQPIKYRSGFKYQLAETHIEQTAIYPDADIVTRFIELTTYGVLTIKWGYAWDGPSGPTIDTLSSMKGSLVHDALYQLIRQKFLSSKRFRLIADKELYRICVGDGGMWRWRAWLWLRELKKFASAAADPKNYKRIKIAP